MVSSSIFLCGLLVTWATPIWLISVGAAVGLLVLAAIYGVLYLVSRPTADGMFATVREGVLLPIFYLVCALSAFAVLGTVLVPGLPYQKVFSSVSRLSSVGDREIEIVVPPSTRNYPLKEVNVPLAELNGFIIDVDEPLSVETNISSSLGQILAFRMAPGSPFSWRKPLAQDKDSVFNQRAEDWKASNPGTKPAHLKVMLATDIEYPQVWIVPGTALALLGLVGTYLALRLGMSKVAAIALVTAKESMAQPLYYVVMALGCFALLAFIYIPYNTFGEDVKMLKDSGLTLIMVLAIIVAVWSASVSVWEEVEGRTALTVLSKPVLRRQFILGKFLGILGPVVVLFVVLGFLFLVTVSYKVVYDSREVAKLEPTWQLCYVEMIRTLPGLVLAFFETVVLTAISVAISTRLPMVANLIVCASIYVLGHLVPMLVNSSVGKFEIVRFVGQFLATVLPVLDHFNIQAAVAAGAAVPLAYLGMAFLYCVLYSTIAMLLGLAMFEDRDLA